MAFYINGVRITKDELRSICRAKGWGGGRFNQAVGREFLERKQVSREDLVKLVGDLRRAARGLGAGTAAPGLSTSDLVKLVGDLRRAARGLGAGTAAPGLSTSDVDALVAKRLAETQPPAATIDMAEVQKMINDAVAKANPHKIILSAPDDTKPVKLDAHAHPRFEKVLKLVRHGGVNVLLVGPAGSGKTTLAHMVAKAMKRSYGTLHCTSGASESQLTGWRLPHKGGDWKYVAAEFIDLYEKGNCVFLLDEIDAADPNAMLVINSALANGAVHVPQRFEKPHVERGRNVTIIAAANTYGTGADMIYAGRNQLDAATLDRFYTVQVDYDTALETKLGDAAVVEWVHELRQKVLQHRVRRVMSTRTIMKMTAALSVGLSLDEAKSDALLGWTKDELAKVGY